MASRISQMRDAMATQQQQYQPQRQQPLDESIRRTRTMMEQFRMMGNREAAVAQLLQQNPQLGQIAQMTRNGQSLESIARSMAQARGIDINQLLQQLGGM